MGLRYAQLFLLGFVFQTATAQTLLKGRVVDSKSDSAVSSANILNLANKIQSPAGIDGSYSIEAKEGDRIVISAVGYKPDTILVQYYMLASGYDIALDVQVGYLSNVTVIGNNYSADSLQRREDYRHILDKPARKLIGGSTPQYGVGLTMSPISFFSSGSKQKRALKKKLLYDEEQAYVDVCFPRSWVSKITGLTGDSLQSFMLRYRPSYKFCREHNKEDMLLYVNGKLKEFMKRE